MKIKGIVVAFAVLLMFLQFQRRAIAGEAENRVRAKLRAAGLSTGYDAKTKRFIAAGSASQEIQQIEGNGKLVRARDSLARSAYLLAKAEIMRSYLTQMSAASTAVSIGSESTSESSFVLSSELFTKVKLPGCFTLCSEESYDKKSHEYEVAVAVGVGTNAAAMVDAIVSGADSGKIYAVDDAMKEWASNNDVFSVLGCRRFVTNSGDAYLMAVGFSDAESGKKSATQMNRVYNDAKEAARNALCFEVFCDTVAKDVLEKGIRECDTSKSWSRIVSIISNKCSGKVVRMAAVKPFEGVHPMTHRKVCAYVVGVGPVNALQSR